MHISLTDQETGKSITVCVDRHTRSARILAWDRSLIEPMMQMVAALGVEEISVESRELQDMGFVDLRFITVRRLNVKPGESTTRALLDMPPT